MGKCLMNKADSKEYAQFSRRKNASMPSQKKKKISERIEGNMLKL